MCIPNITITEQNTPVVRYDFMTIVDSWIECQRLG
jgi:hypothetical protein